MAAIRKLGKSWQAQINKNGIRKSARFGTKAEATAWAAQIESEIISGKRGAIPNKTFGQLLDRYAEEVTPKKKGARWEETRLAATREMDIGKVQLSSLSETHIAEWRDKRLKTVADSTVRREWNLLASACSIAVNEWKWIPDNPFKKLPRPKAGKARDRLYTDNEIERVMFALGYDYNSTPETITARCGAAFLFAVETAMRAGEIVGLTWDRVNLETRVARLLDTKNGHARNVPLSSEAIRILRQLPKNDPVFGVTTNQLYFLFRNGRQTAGIDDATFHDSRHLAITRLAKRLDVLDLARMVGHRDLNSLLVYYNKSAEDMAHDLN